MSVLFLLLFTITPPPSVCIYIGLHSGLPGGFSPSAVGNQPSTTHPLAAQGDEIHGPVESWRKRQPRGDTNVCRDGVVSSSVSC